MRVEFCILASAFATSAAAASSAKCPSFPSSVVEYSSNFKQPAPPLVKSEYATSFIQHKWNENISHITAGYITNSPSQGFVRVEEAYDGKLASSFFDYANVTEEGLVDNTLTEYDGNSTEPAAVFRGYVNSNYPIFQNSILTHSDAVFGGLVERRFSNDHVAAWNIMYMGAIPVTIYLDSCNTVVGYDYFSPGLRTRVVMDFFNIQAAELK